jgi:hypothetical protein
MVDVELGQQQARARTAKQLDHRRESRQLLACPRLLYIESCDAVELKFLDAEGEWDGDK